MTETSAADGTRARPDVSMIQEPMKGWAGAVRRHRMSLLWQARARVAGRAALLIGGVVGVLTAIVLVCTIAGFILAAGLYALVPIIGGNAAFVVVLVGCVVIVAGTWVQPIWARAVANEMKRQRGNGRGQ